MYTKLKLTVRPQKLAFPKRTENSPNHICFGAMLVLGSVHLGFFILRVFFFFFGQLFFVDPRMVRLVDCGGSPKLGRKNSEDGSVVLTPYIWLCIFTNACMAVCQFLMFFFLWEGKRSMVMCGSQVCLENPFPRHFSRQFYDCSLTMQRPGDLYEYILTLGGWGGGMGYGDAWWYTMYTYILIYVYIPQRFQIDPSIF